MVSAGIIERKIEEDEGTVIYRTLLSIILFSSEGVKKNVSGSSS